MSRLVSLREASSVKWSVLKLKFASGNVIDITHVLILIIKTKRKNLNLIKMSQAVFYATNKESFLYILII